MHRIAFLTVQFIFQIFLLTSCQHKPIDSVIVRAPQSSAFYYAPQCQDLFTRSSNKMGPGLLYRPDPQIKTRNINSISRLRVFSQNFENLIGQELRYTLQGKPYIYEKSHEAKASLARRIRAVDPDVIVATEISDIQQAQAYADKYLTTNKKSDYTALMIEGNDPRGIDVVFFVKKDLPFLYQLQSHRNLTSPEMKGEPLFSRDLPALSFYLPGAEPSSDKPLFFILGTHLKSQRSDNPNDPSSDALRELQVLGTVDIIERINLNYPDIPLSVAGDHNKDLRTGREFKPLKAVKVIDSFDATTDTVPYEDRGTHYYFKPIDPLNPQGASTLEITQLDGILVNQAFAPFVVSAKIQKDLDENWQVRPKPRDSFDRKKESI